MIAKLPRTDYYAQVNLQKGELIELGRIIDRMIKNVRQSEIFSSDQHAKLCELRSIVRSITFPAWEQYLNED